MANSDDRCEANARDYALHVLNEAERRAERVLAWSRVAAFLTVVVGLRVFDYADHDHVLLVSLLAYGAATAAAVLLAWRHIYHPLTAWIMATLDVLIVLHFIFVDAVHHGPQPAEVLAHPAPAMTFLLLAFGAVRFRPAIVAYSFALFLVGALTIALSAKPKGMSWVSAVPIEMAGWLAILGLTAGTLCIASARARRLLLQSFRETRLREMLARYVAAPVAQGLDRPGAQGREVAILFVDVRGFTAMSEESSPNEIVTFLESYRALAEGVVTRHRGVVDKFIGDAVLAVFDLLEPSDNAAACIACSIDLLSEVNVWSEARRHAGAGAVQVGMGAHLGPALVGTVGREGRLEYTVIGDAVNTAHRIERMAARRGKPLLASESLVRAAGARWRQRFTFFGLCHLRGRQEPVPLFELKATAVRRQSIEPVSDGKLASAIAISMSFSASMWESASMNA